MWLVLGVLYILLERGLLGELDYYPSTGNPYYFPGALAAILPGALMMGTLFGISEMFIVNDLFLNRSFGEKIFYKALIYMTAIALFISIMSLFSNAYQLQLSILHPEALGKVWKFIQTFAFWGVMLYSAVGIAVMLFFTEVSDNLGPNVLLNFFVGKYHRPREEDRIFMFLDMNSSTTIAEKIGHIKYFKLLNEYYADLSEPILDMGGEIYQYVGDEVVVSWQLRENMNKHAPIECFYKIKEEIALHEAKYKSKYGITPSFKAGIHGGRVSTGEIGTVKKEIVFTGDVLNTASRIQNLCKEYKTEILISEWLIQQIEGNSLYQYEELGEITLKGKRTQVKLYTISDD